LREEEVQESEVEELNAVTHSSAFFLERSALKQKVGFNTEATESAERRKADSSLRSE
jgi:hypothetical protein